MNNPTAHPFPTRTSPEEFPLFALPRGRVDRRGRALWPAQAALAACGNGIVELGEQCDPLFNLANDCCSATCKWLVDGAACSDKQFCTLPTPAHAASAFGGGNPARGRRRPDCSETCNESTNNCDANDPDGSACNDGKFCNGRTSAVAGCATCTTARNLVPAPMATPTVPRAATRISATAALPTPSTANATTAGVQRAGYLHHPGDLHHPRQPAGHGPLRRREVLHGQRRVLQRRLRRLAKEL